MINIETVLPYTGGMESCIGGRKDNQDSCGYSETTFGLLVVVCDGMGGGPSGKLASSMAVNAIMQYVEAEQKNKKSRRTETILKNAIKSANTAIYTHSQEYIEHQGMGTTVVAMIINKEHAVVGHVGDSRCYQMRNGNIIFKTQDHSLVADLVRAGSLTEEQARVSPNSNVITRSLGVNENVEVEIDILPYEKKDRFYLCSDGVWGTMPQKELKKQFYRYPNIANILASTAILVDEIGANNGNHHDNHTLLIIETKTKSKLIAKMSTRDKRIMQILAGLLFISLIINTIAVFNRENIVSKSNTNAQKDSIIMVLKNETKKLKEQLKETKEIYAESFTQIVEDTNLVNNKKLDFVEDNVNEEENVTSKENEKKVLENEKMRKLFFGEMTLLHDWDFIGNGNKKEQATKVKNALGRITPLKNEFSKLGEDKTYEEIIGLFDKYKKDNRNKLVNIINLVKNKYK